MGTRLLRDCQCQRSGFRMQRRCGSSPPPRRPRAPRCWGRDPPGKKKNGSGPLQQSAGNPPHSNMLGGRTALTSCVFLCVACAASSCGILPQLHAAARNPRHNMRYGLPLPSVLRGGGADPGSPRSAGALPCEEITAPLKVAQRLYESAKARGEENGDWGIRKHFREKLRGKWDQVSCRAPRGWALQARGSLADPGLTPSGRVVGSAAERSQEPGGNRGWVAGAPRQRKKRAAARGPGLGPSPLWPPDALSRGPATPQVRFRCMVQNVFGTEFYLGQVVPPVLRRTYLEPPVAPCSSTHLSRTSCCTKRVSARAHQPHLPPPPLLPSDRASLFLLPTRTRPNALPPRRSRGGAAARRSPPSSATLCQPT